MIWAIGLIWELVCICENFVNPKIRPNLVQTRCNKPYQKENHE